jgi:iron-sulfur cluster assembly accessory protein
MITLTDNAQNAIQKFISNSEKPVAGLRVMVTGGGCSGMQYGMRLEEQVGDEDQVITFGDITVFIDPQSSPMLEGVTVDFLDSMEGSGFKFENPNASASCGCGKSFSC